MPVSITWNYAAASCPAVPYYSTLLDPADDTQAAPTAYRIGSSTDGTAAQVVRPGMDANGKRVDMVGFYGGGALAVLRGCDLSVSGTAQSVGVVAGVVGIGAGVKVAAQTVALTASATNHLWALSSGAISVRTDLLLPTMPAVYLGRVTVNGSGVVTEIDYSGRLYVLGCSLWRRTGDADLPADTPPAGYAINTITQSGTFRWNGLAYEDPGQTALNANLTFASADLTLAASHYRKRTLVAGGTNAAPQALILPNIAGLSYIVYNGTGQALTVKVTGQPGFAIATGKHAIARCTGTDYVRVTADT